MINPLWLRSFCTLVELGHFTRTAEKLNMTQSGVSQHIRKLEAFLNQVLLLRHGKQFSLTNAGQRLYQEGRTLVHALEGLEYSIGQDPPHEGQVNIASPGSVGLKLYPYLLKLQQRHPKLVIEYRFAPNNEIERLLAEGKLDLGLMTCLPTQAAQLKLKAVAEDELRLVTPAGTSSSWQQLQSLGFIDHPDGSYHARQLLQVNYPEFQHFSQFKHSGFSNQINLILEPVSMGLGFTVLPNHAVRAFKDSKKLEIHTLENSVTETLYISTHKNRYCANRIKTVISEIEICLKNI